MNRTKLSLLAILAAGLVSVTGSAFAVEAVATGTVNVRSGPGIDYAKVATLQAGTKVNVTECENSFCFVQKPGTDGWVSSKYLAEGAADDLAEADIPVHFGMSVGPGGPSISFGIGDAPPPAPLPAVAEVCFYKGSNFASASFCVSPGSENDQLVGGWDNSISSIQVAGGADVTVCKNWFYGGGCTTYSNDKPNLNGNWNNKISSFQVF